jgi:aspartyl-tRNA(Asn)/glutamyl-tRNA(Gln) amidotransferase subunit C
MRLLLSAICSSAGCDCIPDAAAEKQAFALLAAWPLSAIAKTSRCYGETFGRTVEARAAAMSVDADTVRRVAHLARLAVAEDEVEHLRGELNAILAFVEQLAEVKVDGIEPMTSIAPMAMKMRQDEVTDGNIAEAIMANAPAREDHFFLVPKVVE